MKCVFYLGSSNPMEEPDERSLEIELVAENADDEKKILAIKPPLKFSAIIERRLFETPIRCRVLLRKED